MDFQLGGFVIGLITGLVFGWLITKFNQNK